MLDANTFNDSNIIELLNNQFVSMKINAETDYGNFLFNQYHGNAYPLILFLDKNKNEIDRFYGYYSPEDFLEKLESIVNNEKTYPKLLEQYHLGDNRAETMALLAEKYADRGQDSLALALFERVLISKNVSLEMFHKAQYFIDSNALKKKGPSMLESYIEKYPDSPFLKEAINQLLYYYNQNKNEQKELYYFNKSLNIFRDDPWFLNQYAWRMTELNQNLELALIKINLALTLLEENAQGVANIIDTKAEILWKLGNTDEALQTIDKAIIIDPDNEYYKKQKNKFLQSKL